MGRFNILIEAYQARHGDMRYDLTFNDSTVWENLTLVDMLSYLLDYLSDPEEDDE